MSSISVTDTFDRPLRDLRISVTDRCNLRCPYCMPHENTGACYNFLARKDILTFEEIARVAHIAQRLGVQKVRLTGGEPLLRSQLPALVEMIAGIEGLRDVALTTNGILLPRYATALKAAGLGRLTISLDSLDPRTFALMSGGLADVSDVVSGIDAAQRAGFTGIKINAVIKRDVNEEGALDLVRWCKDRGLTMRFIEYMDVGTRNLWKLDDVVPSHVLKDRIEEQFPLVPLNARHPGETAERYGFADGSGEVGFISSVTQPFCGDCTRLRLSAEGRLYTCLFATEGVDIRGPMREGAKDEELFALLTETWRARRDRYSELRAGAPGKHVRRVEMHHIGG